MLCLPVIATNDVMQIFAHQKSLLDTVHCIRTRATLANAGRYLTPNAECRQISQEMSALFWDAPDS